MVMADSKPPEPPPPPPKDERQARLAEALRANLRRRKAAKPKEKSP